MVQSHANEYTLKIAAIITHAEIRSTFRKPGISDQKTCLTRNIQEQETSNSKERQTSSKQEFPTSKEFQGEDTCSRSRNQEHLPTSLCLTGTRSWAAKNRFVCTGVSVISGLLTPVKVVCVSSLSAAPLKQFAPNWLEFNPACAQVSMTPDLVSPDKNVHIHWIITRNCRATLKQPTALTRR